MGDGCCQGSGDEFKLMLVTLRDYGCVHLASCSYRALCFRPQGPPVPAPRPSQLGWPGAVRGAQAVDRGAQVRHQLVCMYAYV